jgi:hypothetical protein
MFVLQPSYGTDHLILLLLKEMPAVGEKIKKDYEILDGFFRDARNRSRKGINTDADREEFDFHQNNARGCAQLIAADLRQIAEMAKSDLRPTDAAITAEEPRAQNVFRKEGDVWRVSFHGKTTSIKHVKGMSYIAHLLEKPGKEIPASELVKIVEKTTGERPATSVGPQEFGDSEAAPARGKSTSPGDADAIIDEQYQRECREKWDELKMDLDRAKRDGDYAAEERTQSEIDKLTDVLDSTIGLRGKSRSFRDDFQRAKDSVRKSIDRAMNRINGEHADLWRHLENTISVGSTCSYKPDRKMDWQL